MDTKLYAMLEDVTNNLTALKQTHIFIGRMLLPVYGENIKTKKELAKYIYNGGIHSMDGDYINETTKSYFKYFEDIYKDYEPFAANALGTSREHEHFKDYPEIHNIYRKFAFDFYSNKFVLKETQSKNMDYNVPLWYVPILSAFIRVLYSNKKLDKISAEQFLECISTEIYSVIFGNFSTIYSADTDLGKPDTLKLLYRYNIGILYEINSMYIGSDDPVIMPYVPSVSGLYHAYMIQLRQSSYRSFFTHIIELYWKSTWKPLIEGCTYQVIQNHYTYDTEPISLILIDNEIENFINNRLLERTHSRFNTVSDAFDKIDSCLEKFTENKDWNKCLDKIDKITKNYLKIVKNYNNDIVFPLAEQIYNKLEQLALSRKDIIICHTDKESMKSDYTKIFHNIFGIYDMAATAIKYILRDKTLSDEDKCNLLKTQILPQLKTRDKTDCFNRLKMEYINFHHILKILNIAPVNFESDIQEIKQLFQIGCCPKNIIEENICGQFDRLVENIISLCPDKDNCFSYIFQISVGDM